VLAKTDYVQDAQEGVRENPAADSGVLMCVWRLCILHSHRYQAIPAVGGGDESVFAAEQ
jgi:hypothetical protein